MAFVGGKTIYRRAYFGVDAMLIRTKDDDCLYNETAFSMSFLHCSTLKREDLAAILEQGSFRGISASIHKFGRQRSLRLFVKHVCLLHRVLRANDDSDDTEYKVALAKYRVKCMEHMENKKMRHT